MELPERLSRLPRRELAGGLVVVEAATALARLRGLAGLDALPPHVALHLDPCRSVHTFGMRFALDLVWLGPDGTVVRVDRGVAPRRHRAALRARSVVEARAGAADAFLAAGLGASRGGRGGRAWRAHTLLKDERRARHRG